MTAARPQFAIERLSKKHDRSSFASGNAVLDHWLRSYASQFEKRDLARVYVALRQGDVRVCGFYSLSTHHVVFEQLATAQAKGLPQLDIPVVLLGRLAVDQREQGQGLGSALLISAFDRILELADIVGIRAVEVDAIDEAARQFYLRHGFEALIDDPRHLYLSIQVVRKLRAGN